MAIHIHCPQCGKKLNAPDSAAGKRARCPQCKAIVTLPPAGAAAASHAPADEILDAEPVSAPVAAPPMPDPDPYDIPLAPPAAPPPFEARSQTTMPQKPCPMCGEMIPLTAPQCPYCREFVDPAMRQQAQRGRAVSTSSNAIWALVCGIGGFFCFGFILGAIAISLGSKARKEIAESNGMIGGGGLAMTGIVLGWIDIVAWVLVLIGRFANQ